MSLSLITCRLLQNQTIKYASYSPICKLLHTNQILHKAEDRREMIKSLPVKDQGTIGEKSIDIDNLMRR